MVASARTQEQHALLSLDIDKTMIHTEHCHTEVLWIGGDAARYTAFLLALKQVLKERFNIVLHIAINTFKTEEDDLAKDVIAKFTEAKLLEPRLVFYTNFKSKVANGLLPAKKLIEGEYKTEVKPEHIIHMDDMIPAISEVIKAGFVGIQFGDVKTTEPLDIQKRYVNEAFEKLYTLFNVADALPYVNPKKTTATTAELLKQMADVDKLFAGLNFDDEPPAALPAKDPTVKDAKHEVVAATTTTGQACPAPALPQPGA